ncbi:MAG: hypothetical protein GJ676_06985 [Rhodobacteraceae bacterium]|nr:hypothetical protein [Paracoccaceae bacterium]
MTKHDLRIALIIAGLVVVLGWGIGFAVGLLTRPAETVVASDTQSERVHRPPVIEGQYPGYEDVYVNDYADLLTPEAETDIRTDLIELYDYTGVEMTLLTIHSMGDFGHHGAIEPFATGLFNAWRIGDATRNDGVLVLISRYDRRMRIEIGSGYGASWDARMQRVIDTGFLPSFRKDEYQTGILLGMDETIREVSGRYPGSYETGTARQGWMWIWAKTRQLGEWVLSLLLVPVAGFGLWLRRYIRNRPRDCSACGTRMMRAGEEADDEHLNGGQVLEEFLKSVDYDVWHCPGCGHMEINRYRNWFSLYGACPKCQFRTLSTTSTVLVSATKTRQGKKRVEYDCQHCGYHDSELRTIPKVSDSSSGSSRSSFGGGSSSGGGASGSW